MNNTYNIAEIAYQNTKYGGNWIRMGEKTHEKEFTLYATGDATMNGRIYIALPKKELTHEEKIKYNIM